MEPHRLFSSPTRRDNFAHMFDHQVSQSVTTTGGVTYWRPATPGPLYVGWRLRKCQCDCGARFESLEDYEAHYLYMASQEGRYIVRFTPISKIINEDPSK